MFDKEINIIALIIPAFNEEAGNSNTLNQIEENFNSEFYEIIVVDDCSNDKTAEIVSSFDSMKLLQYSENK